MVQLIGAGHMLIGTLMVFGLDGETYNSFDSNEMEYFQQMVLEISKDAWQIYAQTKNVFGHDINEKWIFDNDDLEKISNQQK